MICDFGRAFSEESSRLLPLVLLLDALRKLVLRLRISFAGRDIQG
jgi:hypothetical protein